LWDIPLRGSVWVTCPTLAAEGGVRNCHSFQLPTDLELQMRCAIPMPGDTRR